MKTVHVADLGEVITGHTPPTDKREYYGSFKLFIKPTDISTGSKHTYVTEESYSETGYEKYKNSLIPKGATCVVCIGTLGEKITMTHCDCFTNQSINSIIPNKYFDEQYVYYLLKNNLHQVKSLNKGTASGREFVSKSSFLDMKLQVYEDLNVQKKIGNILCTYDSLIENNQKQIKLLEEAAQRLYKEWFVDLRFPGYEAVIIKNGLPNGWVKAELKDIAFFSGKPETKDSREKYNYYLPIDCLPRKSISYINFEPIEFAESSLVSFEKDDVLFGSMRPYFHKVVVARDKGLTRTTCFVINAKNNRMWSYLLMVLFSKSTVNYATSISVGTTMPYVRWSDFEHMPVIIPQFKIVEAFNDILKPIINEINNLASQIINLTEARDRLLPKLMNGEIEL